MPVRGCKDEINDVRLLSIGGSSSSGSRGSRNRSRSSSGGGGGGGEVRLLLLCSFPSQLTHVGHRPSNSKVLGGRRCWHANTTAVIFGSYSIPTHVKQRIQTYQ